MSTAEQPLVFEELIDRVLRFRLSEHRQQKLDELLDKNRLGTLSAEETVELATFEQFEHVVRMLKAKLLGRRALP